MNLRVHYYIQPYTVSCRTSNTIKAFWNVEHQIHISVLLFSYLNLLSTSSLLSYSVHSSPLMAFERDLYSECMKTQTSNVGRPNFFYIYGQIKYYNSFRAKDIFDMVKKNITLCSPLGGASA